MSLLLFVALAVANQLDWSFEVEKGSTIDIELRIKDGDSLFRILSTDNVDKRNFGWRTDKDDRLGHIKGEFPKIFLENGEYQVEFRTTNTFETIDFGPSEPPSKLLPVLIPKGAKGVMAFHHNNQGDGLDGFSYASNHNGVAFLPLDDQENWTAIVVSEEETFQPEQLSSTQDSLGFLPLKQNYVRKKPTELNWMVQFILVPITVVILVLAVIFIRKIKERKPHLYALSAGGIISLWVTQNILLSPGSAILHKGDGYDDPPTSISLLWSIADGIPGLSENATTFSFPEGHSWLIMGPSWLAYVLMSPVSWISNAITAHNTGIFVFSTLNFYCIWLLARQWKIHPLISGIAGLGAILSPVYLNEIETLSLDRCLLFPIPLFILCVQRIYDNSHLSIKENALPIFGGGAVLCLGLISQTYYGIYLAAAAPFLIIPRLFGSGSLHRLKSYFLMGLIGLLMMSPLLIILNSSVEDTVYDSESSLFTEVSDVWNPIESNTAEESLDRILQTGRIDMETPKSRLVTSIFNSLYPYDLIYPAEYLYGAHFYWLLILLSLIASKNKKRQLISISDATILMIFALGPILKYSDNQIGGLLPYYFYHLLIPSFDQLKHPYRFILMASMLSTIPIALGLHNILGRLKGNKQSLGFILCFGLFLVCIRRPSPERQSESHTNNMSRMELFWDKLPKFKIKFAPPTTPKKRTVPKYTPLDAIEGKSAVIYPFTEPLPIDLYLATTQRKISLLNDPPHGVDPSRKISSLLEENTPLNQLAWLSGSDRLRRRLLGAPSVGFEQLRNLGIEAIILFVENIPTQRRKEVTQEWLKQNTTLLVEDNSVSVWTF
jgi:hypothetical protein